MSVITIKRSAIGQERNRKPRRSFRELSRRYFASEKKFEFIIELLLFAILVAISAWADPCRGGRAQPTASDDDDLIRHPRENLHNCNAAVTKTSRSVSI